MLYISKFQYTQLLLTTGCLVITQSVDQLLDCTVYNQRLSSDVSFSIFQ